MRFSSLLPALVVATQLTALKAEPNTLGVQVRLSVPGGNLPDASGSRNPGLGGGLQAELNLDDSHFAIRVVVGADDWRKGAASQNSAVQAYHIGTEGIYFLRDEGLDHISGPYLLLGLSSYTWAMGADARPDGKPLRVSHAVFHGGFGYRINRYLDLELKLFTGKVELGFVASATQVGVTYRF